MVTSLCKETITYDSGLPMSVLMSALASRTTSDLATRSILAFVVILKVGMAVGALLSLSLSLFARGRRRRGKGAADAVEDGGECEPLPPLSLATRTSAFLLSV
mmetsp:Transcript_3743/g.9449  ORF Transcript_3743/g.9449 Transcript_3743/m.9449 type:complete len:103 (-) Transcript_3743:41-349(-)